MGYLSTKIVNAQEVSKEYLEVFGTPVPPNSFIALAEYDGQVVGIASLQPIWHIEPIWIDPRWRGRGVFQRLLGLLVPCIPRGVEGILCMIKNPKLSKLCARLGGEEIPWKTFRWRLKDG